MENYCERLNGHQFPCKLEAQPGQFQGGLTFLFDFSWLQTEYDYLKHRSLLLLETLSYDYYVIIFTIIIIFIVFIFIFNFIIIIIIIITTIFTWDWSACEFYNTATAHPETSIVSLGPATRGSDSRPDLYSATTADPETSIVSSSPATRGSYSRPDLYCTATAHTKCRVVGFSSTSGANKSTLLAFCCHVV